ncbi:ScyD/ScyE family protein [Nonomuraea sp. KM90]|uniref:ScyD/ScyE family protein n=1 Tax=Nonomuraea sp. KM90 TaxID=3457428 RepID=UPI003FCEA44E
MKKSTRGALALALTGTALSTLILPADPAAARAGGTIEVVAEGLDTPRGLIYDAGNRRVLVAEAGEGGPSGPDGGTCGQTGLGAVWCYGPTGAIFQYSERRRSGRRIVTGLPSTGIYDDSGAQRFSVLGVHDLSLSPAGHLRAVFGLAGERLFRDQLGPGAVPLGQLARVTGHSGGLVPEADLATYEQRHDPHPGDTESNLYGLDSGPYGTVVVDASGNDVLLVRPDGGIKVLAVLPARAPAADPGGLVESVPTAVVRGPGGAFYVGELSGFPYHKGEAKVWRLVPGRAPTVYADGFTNIADLTFDERGRLIVLEMAKDGLFDGNPGHGGDTVTGRLVRVNADGSRTDLATTGLENPGGVAYAGDGVFYVTNRSTGAGDTGQLLRVKVPRG